jgi:hypothetical protein
MVNLQHGSRSSSRIVTDILVFSVGSRWITRAGWVVICNKSGLFTVIEEDVSCGFFANLRCFASLSSGWINMGERFLQDLRYIAHSGGKINTTLYD